MCSEYGLLAVLTVCTSAFLKPFSELHFGTVLKAHLSHQFSHGFLNIFLEPGTGCGWEGSSRYGSKEQKTERRE